MIKFGNILEALGIAALALTMSGCAKETAENKNIDNKRALESWMSIHYPDITKTGLGIYIIDDQPGTGRQIAANDEYAFVQYTTYTLEGDVKETTSEEMDKQLGKFSKGNYYGDEVIHRDRTENSAGLLEMLNGMRIGGTRTAVIPGWINVAKDLKDEEAYLKDGAGYDMICTMTLKDAIEDVYDWETDTLERYVTRWMDGVDSTHFGYYYKQLAEPTDTASLPRDTTVRINYIGRLMNGKVFDTTIADTAKFYGIYSPTRDYSPVYINLADEASDITMSTSSNSDATSSIVNGFAYCMMNMKNHEKGIAAFYSVYGYGKKGSSPGIPKYAPISFEIEIIDEE